MSCIRGHIESSGTHLVSDENTACRNAGIDYKHSVVHHAAKLAEDNVHVNNIESFWAVRQAGIVRRALPLQQKYMPLFLSGSCWKYNHRDYEAPFDAFVDGIVRRL